MLREFSSTNAEAGDEPTVGIVGGGQLARMLIEAAVRLGIATRVLVSAADDCAAAISPAAVLGDHRDLDAVRRFAGGCDVVTFDHERTPAPVLEGLEAAGAVLRPGARAMAMASDKAEQRRLATEIGLPVARHAIVRDADGLRRAVDRLGLPAVAKATQGGYDGRGVRWLRSATAVDDLARELASAPATWLVEPHLDIEVELAVSIVRRPGGAVAAYPVVETVQHDGICRTVIAPARTDERLADQLVAAARRLADRLDLVGALAVETFVVGGELVLNELAPRPHNSAHYTIDACVTSQFENHLRAVLGLPLGDTTMLTPSAVMANVIASGPTLASLHDVRPPPGTSVHLYGKRPRAGRKVGHVVALGPAGTPLERRAAEVAAALSTPAPATPGSDRRAVVA